MPVYTKLPISNVAATNVTQQCDANLVEFLQYGFLEANGFVDEVVTTPGTTGPYDRTACSPLQKNGVADGSIWQAQFVNWCYESGLESGNDPVVAAGVYVNGTYYPTASTTGVFGHHLDFRNGRVVFSSAIPTASVVQVAHSHRWVNVYDQSVPWFEDVILNGYLTDQQNQQNGGLLAVLDDYRVQTPFVVVETGTDLAMEPRQLGDRSKWAVPAVLFHVVAEDKATRDNVANALSCLRDQTIVLFDADLRRRHAAFALDWKGSPVSPYVGYPSLVSSYPWKTAWFRKVRTSDVSPRLPLFRAAVRADLVTDFTPA